MAKHLIYAFTAVILIGLAKILQVFVYDEASHVRKKDKVYFDDNKDYSEMVDTLPANGIIQEEGNEAAPIDTATFDSLPEQNTITSLSYTSNTNGVENEAGTPLRQVSTADSYPMLDALIANYLNKVNAGMEDGHSRQDIVIRYYRHEKDGDKVDELRKLRYYIHEKEATETRGLGSNMIYYGRNVAVEDIQIVALTLLKNGIPLKSIKPSRYEWKANAIEIGTDSDLLDAKNLTIEEVRSFSK